MAGWTEGQIDRVKQAWGRWSPGQRWLVGGLGGALALAIGLSYYLNRPDWVVLVSQADPKDAAAVVARLQELKVQYRPIGDGYTIQVPRAEQYTAKLALAQSGLPKGASVGMELFDEPKFGATEFDRKVNYLRAQQGELERALTRISEVEYANVKLAIPERSVFLRDQQSVKASVLIQPRVGRRLTADQVAGIVNFMAGSVQGLSPENVTVLDQSGRLLSSGRDMNAPQGLDPDQVRRQDQLQTEMERRVQTLLEPIFGTGNVIARVNVELNLETSRVETQTVGGATPKSTETVREATKAGTAAADTAAAPRPAEAGAPPVYQGQNGAGGGEDQWKTKTTTTYEVSNRKEVTVVGPGAVKRLSVGIAINRTDLSGEQIKQVKESVSGATGADVAMINVAAMLFTQTPPQEIDLTPASPLKTYSVPIALATVSVLLLLGFMVRRRRSDEPVTAGAAMADGRTGDSVGRTLDVALGRTEAELADSRAPGVAAAASGGTPAGPGRTEAAAQHRLEQAISGRSARVLPPDPANVDDETIAVIDELLARDPEACAEMMRQWLKE